MPIASLEKWADAVSVYLNALRGDIGRGIYTEHTHRPTLKTFLETTCPAIIATNEPQRVKCGAPDFIITHGASPWGYIETKDIDASLDKEEKSEQLIRYRDSLSNLILTDYLEFRWYRDGALREPIVRIAELKQNNKLVPSDSGIGQLRDLLLGFLNANVRTIKGSKHLAELLAGLTRTLATVIESAYALEGDDEELHNNLKSIQELLVHDFSTKQFVDMYAQTIAYGLFAARTYCKKAEEFTRERAAYFIPRTNPFLSNLFGLIAGPGLNTRYAWVVDDMADLLAKTDMDVIWKDFGTARDPVVDFYETFLSIYDPELREKRGVYYTPTQVVNYIVRSIDEILKDEFGIKQGLTDSQSLVLDPACGTGTFLYSLIKLVQGSLKGQEGSWSDYVSQNLLKRMFGFEFLMAPYVIAHLKLALELQVIDKDFKQDQRFGVYLTNSLEEGLKKSEVMFAKWLSDEANAASEIKREKPIMVVFGNPPYSGHSPNKGDWIRQLVHDYRMLDGNLINEKQVKWLQDDYVKFIRFGQWRIEQTGQGILGYITNHGYLDDITFYAMRKNLLDHFTKIYVLNLHGNKNRNPRGLSPEGKIDENVFDITQGVSIGIFLKNPKEKSPATIHYYDLWGSREEKYAFLEANTTVTTPWVKWYPSTPRYAFIPSDTTLDAEFEAWYSLREIFPINNVGFVTGRDEFAIDIDRKSLEARVDDFRDPTIKDDEIAEKYGLHDTTSWKLKEARQAVRDDRAWRRHYAKCLYRPFDERWIFFSNDLLERPVLDASGPLLSGKNLAFIGMRQVVQDDMSYSHFTVVRHPVDNRCFRSNKGIVQVYPLFAAEPSGHLAPNIGREFKEHLCIATKMDWSSQQAKGKIDPLSVLHYVTAIAFSNSYRTKYSQQLRIQDPRIPIYASKECFLRLRELGSKVVDAVTLENVGTTTTKFPISGTSIVGNKYPTYDRDSRRVHINEDQFFEGIPESVWEYQLGGRLVCFEWLKDRRGRPLTFGEKATYQNMVSAIITLSDLSDRIDKTMAKHEGRIFERPKDTKLEMYN